MNKYRHSLKNNVRSPPAQRHLRFLIFRPRSDAYDAGHIVAISEVTSQGYSLVCTLYNDWFHKLCACLMSLSAECAGIQCGKTGTA